MMLPDFLIIGAPRSGTTFLSQTLAKHPDICMSKSRETHFFDRHYDKGINWYSQNFKHCKEDNIIGEKTASYLVEPKTAKRIRDNFNDIKLLVILRNPIDRVYSHYKNMIRLGRIKQNYPFNKFIHEQKQILEMGNYYKHLKKYLTYFTKKNLLVLLFEELTKKTDKTYKIVLNYLNIRFYKRIKVDVDNQTKRFYKFGEHILTQKQLKILKKIPIINKNLCMLKYRFPEMKKTDREKLKKYYSKKNKKLFKLLQINNIWSN